MVPRQLRKTRNTGLCFRPKRLRKNSTRQTPLQRGECLREHKLGAPDGGRRILLELSVPTIPRSPLVPARSVYGEPREFILSNSPERILGRGAGIIFRYPWDDISGSKPFRSDSCEYINTSTKSSILDSTEVPRSLQPCSALG